jgi:hypothetical protein
LLKHEPSAQIPWQNTMLGLVCGDIVHSFGLVWSSGPVIRELAMRIRVVDYSSSVAAPPSLRYRHVD